MIDKDSHRYDDIINLTHHQSATRPHMSLYDRAAQFSPFAALTGFDDAVKETARLTDEKIELDEEEKAVLNDILVKLKQNVKEEPKVSITYFLADKKKSGGAYVTETGNIKKIDEYTGRIKMQNQIQIPIEDIIEIIIR